MHFSALSSRFPASHQAHAHMRCFRTLVSALKAAYARNQAHATTLVVHSLMSDSEDKLSPWWLRPNMPSGYASLQVLFLPLQLLYGSFFGPRRSVAACIFLWATPCLGTLPICSIGLMVSSSVSMHPGCSVFSRLKNHSSWFIVWLEVSESTYHTSFCFEVLASIQLSLCFL